MGMLISSDYLVIRSKILNFPNLGMFLGLEIILLYGIMHDHKELYKAIIVQ